MRAITWGLVLFSGLFLQGARGRAETMSDAGASDRVRASEAVPSSEKETSTTEVITLGGGCFWCLEAVFNELHGVRSVHSGYAGGTVANPSYQQVCSGTTGHAEVVQVELDPRVLSLHDLLEVFFTIHDPTTLNRQGADVGTQYRSVILYRNDAQKAVAEQVLLEIRDRKIWDRPLVTQIVPLETFYRAEDYHQRYYEENPSAGYCRVVIEPKVQKFRETFRDRLARR